SPQAIARTARARARPDQGFRGRRNGWTRLGQPPLAPLVVLDVAERFALALGNAEVELLDILVLAQRLGLAVHDDTAVLQDIAVARVFQRHIGVLLGEQEGHALLAVEVL